MKNRFDLNLLRNCLLVGAGLLFFNFSFGQALQEENKKTIRHTEKILREAEKELSKNDFASAEASYRQAVSKNPESVTARYNMANMYYGKEKPGQAASRYNQAGKIAETKEEKHKIFHNMGNSFMLQKNYAGAVEAYKNALRNNPSDEETRYNLALAQKMLEKEKQDGGGGDDDKKDEEKDDKNKDNKDDKGEKDQDKKDGEDKEDKGGDQKDDPKQEPEKPDDKGDPKEKKDQEGDQEKEQQSQPQPGQLSPQQIKNLLEAMNNEEKKVQEKINAQKAKGAKTRTEKDW